MRLHILSDLHLGCSSFTLPKVDADVLVLAGDIADDGTQAIFPMVQEFVAQGGRVVWVPGNHEFYGQRIGRALLKLSRGARRAGVDLLHNRSLIIGNVRFLGTPLWTDFEVEGRGFRDIAMLTARDMVADYSCIMNGPKTLAPQDTLRYHQRAVRFLRQQLEQPFDGKTVVVTHHGPTPQSIAGHYRGNLVNGSFCSDLTELFYEYDIDLWIHGHTHNRFEYTVRGTPVVCNPRGYVKQGMAEALHFDPHLVKELT